jgi:anthranilate/para-aminobenzoate synthase component II
MDREDFRSEVLPNVDCVILSPGPGRPDKPEVKSSMSDPSRVRTDV